MSDSIKKQIMDKVLALLEPMHASGLVRSITREVDLTINAPSRPALQVYDGPERLTSKDNRGRTFHFDIAVKVLVESQRDLGAAKDALVPEVQRILESNLQLGGLAVIVDGGEEVPFTSELQKPLGGSLVMYTIQYRRILGDPTATY
jgi:hypothetical protein